MERGGGLQGGEGSGVDHGTEAHVELLKGLQLTRF